MNKNRKKLFINIGITVAVIIIAAILGAIVGELKYKLVSALEENGVQYDYFEFPHCNHGMYRDFNILEQFLKQSLVYCKTYF